MSEHRAVFAPAARSSFSRRRRWVTGAVGALGAGGLIFGGLARAASPSDVVGSVRLDVWADAHGGWLGEELSVSGAAGSAYGEGQTVPFRLDLTAAGAGTFDVSVCRAHADGAEWVLSLDSYMTSRTPPIAPGAVVTEEAGGSEQPFTGAAVGGSVHIDAVTEVGGPGACGPGWRETQVRVTITGAASGASPVGAYVLWGGRLASPADPGVGPGHGASQFPGGISMRLAAAAEIRSSGADPTVDVDATADVNVEHNPDAPVPDPDPDPTPPLDPDPSPDPSPLPDPITVPDPGPVVPPDPGGVVPPDLDPPVGPGTDPGERCASSRTTPRCEDADDPAGDTGDPANVGSTTEVHPASVVAGDGNNRTPAPEEEVLGRDGERTPPAAADSPAEASSPTPAGATLPNTGGGAPTGALRVLGLAALGRALLGRTGRRRAARS